MDGLNNMVGGNTRLHNPIDVICMFIALSFFSSSPHPTVESLCLTLLLGPVAVLSPQWCREGVPLARGEIRAYGLSFTALLFQG